MKKITILFMAVVAMLVVAPGARAQGTTGQFSATVDARDAHIVDVGTVCIDVLQWAVEDSVTHKIDTIYTAEPYILWQRDGDIEAQAEARRARVLKIGTRRKISTTKRTGSLMAGWIAEYQYNVFVYNYPSVDADGKPVTLSAIAACPTKSGTSEVRDVIIGTHITITSNAECPSLTTQGFTSSDWGMLFSFAGGPKLRLGWKTNLIAAAATSVLIFTVPVSMLWGTVDIATASASADPSQNYNLVIMPDYEGYGETSSHAHPYLYQELTARQCVDATLYGIELYKNDSGLKDIRHPLRSNYRTLSCGYSQGGSVAMAVHRFIEQNGLADQLHFVGSICGDGPYDPMSTLMYYMERDLAGHKMSMAVVLPLIVKGMLDTNPYMKTHKVEDYFTDEFLSTGIMQWLTDKRKTTDDIENSWASQARQGMTTIFDNSGKAMMRDIMKPSCYNYFKGVYEANKNTFTNKEGIPLPTHRGLFEDLHFALASNDMTSGWTPEHAVFLFHSKDDTVVPFVNFTKASNSFGKWAVPRTINIGRDHVPAGEVFFRGIDNDDIKAHLTLHIYMGKK
ncbi:MAG: hypothetical protein J6X70_03795, partial [Muribaculaceae bacterium]|nr:hypothetical protein [Muribaculaceae bacterium]